MKQSKYNNILKATRFLALVVLMAFGTGLKGWGQVGVPGYPYHKEWEFCYDRPNVSITNKTQSTFLSETTDTIYVMPGKTVDITLQYAPTGENINGYVRWYVQRGDSEIIDNLIRGGHNSNDNNLGITLWPQETLVQYKNGYAWFRYAKRYSSNVPAPQEDYTNILSNLRGNNGDIHSGNIPDVACYITYKCDVNYDNSNPDIVVCEASSLIDFGDPLSENKGEREAPTLSVRRNYVIQTATKIQTKLNANREAVIGITNGSQWLDNDDVNLPDDIIQNPSKYFKEVYTIHTPIFNGGTGTNYRLAEKINNYYVGSNEEPINQVRWRWYNESGKFIGSEIKTQPEGHPATTDYSKYPVANIKHIKFDISDITVQYTRYLTAEVRKGSGDWYPISFQKIILDPYSAPMTEDELEQAAINDFAYSRRLERILENPNRYKLIKGIDFDTDKVNELTVDNNTASEPYAADTYYAFAYPSKYNERGNGSRTTGRGEYGLYRSLNYSKVSQKDNNYQDYFINSYNHYVIDRLADSSEDLNYGYFMYVDAADEPGVIAKIPFAETLCSNTSLIVTAWVCNLQHSPYEGETGVSPADIGITFKGIKDGKETIITKFYSGELLRKHDGNVDNPDVATQALWQQVYFNFTNTTNIDYDSYLVELSNNTRSSNGADYAVDDIRVYRSLPDINVQRQDACEASHLFVSSDYTTILNNMGWSVGDNVLEVTNSNINDWNIRKYRYGFLTKNIILNPEKVGNVYFGVLDGDKFDKIPHEIEWVTVNKSLEDEENETLRRLSKVIRSVVPTNLSNEFERFPTTEDDALNMEVEINIQAIRDYNEDVIDRKYEQAIQIIDLGDLAEITYGKGSVVRNNSELYKLYETKIKELYSILGVPRIHVPWKEVDEKGVYTLFLSSIDVSNTDMKYVGEQIGNSNEKASGHYKVILFSAKQVAEGVIPDPKNDECALISDFYVYPSIRITVNTETSPSDIACLGAVHHVDAILVTPKLDDNGYPTGVMEELTDVKYNFDWFLGSISDYDNIKGDNGRDLKTIIAVFRENSDNADINNGGSFTYDDVQSSGVLDPDEKDILKKLLSPPSLLVTGKSIDFQLVGQIVAMPYVYNGNVDETNTLYCTELQEVELKANPDVPDFSPGFNVPEIVELNDIPLRLGLINIKESKIIPNIPIQKDVRYGVQGASNDYVLKRIEGNLAVLLDQGGKYQHVATLVELFAQQDGVDNNMTILFEENVEQYFSEGQEYNLLIPFGEYENKEAVNVVPNSCEGYATLRIKIVPEYLTWRGGNWYNDENWNQSTKAEIYVGNDNTDANGNDDVQDAFAPLYFTNITIPDNTELKLTSEDEAVWGNIQYDMAVDKETDGSIKVVPYYINKVDQIYFKPGATLLNQHLLTYNKARVDFEMTKGQPYWMSSPLKDVYAGDMYAPAATGRQETPAFVDITYDKATNSRWGLPFYQKAWDKAVTYYTDTQGSIPVEVGAVKSNWSIEYNDVTVPYTLGKGFYSRVEGNNAMVRLPKADQGYSYEEKATTRALEIVRINGEDYAQLAGETITLDLSKDVDGDGNHFLIGNPYMAYLNMKAFFTENPGLAEKYWVLNDGTASVGTPDVNWVNEQSDGYIAPMQAFFVERAGYSTTETQADEGTVNVTFNINMTVSQEEATNPNPGTRSFKATNPQLTILAKGAEGKSVSFVVQSDFAENVYKSDEDAVALLDSELKIPMVYTVAGNCAAAVNKVKDMQNIPLGVYAEEDEEVEVTIEGMSQFVDSLYLHDALTGKSVLLDGNTYTLRVNGENHGRYTITTKGGITVESNICVYSPSSNNLMIAASPSETLEQVRVFDMSGRIVENRVDLGSSNCRLRIASGIYIVYAKTEAGETKVKVRVK